jgi:hypothetical protein
VITSVGVTFTVVSALWTNRAGGVGVPALPDEHVGDLPVLVGGAVDVAPDTGDVDVGRIDAPPITRRVPGQGERRRRAAN